MRTLPPLALASLLFMGCSDDASPVVGALDAATGGDVTVTDAAPGAADASLDTSVPRDASDAGLADTGMTDAGLDAEDSGDAPFDGLTGAFVDKHWRDDGTTTRVPHDLSALTVQVVVPGGSNIVGSGKADGTFAIPNVPAGTQLVQVGPWYLVTDQRTFDLALDVMGRTDAVLGSSATSLEIDVTGLTPTPDGGVGDLLYVLATNVGRSYGIGGPFTATQSIPIDLDSSPLLEQAKGDTLIVAEYTPHGAPPNSLSTLGKVFSSTAVTTANGQQTVVNAAMTTPGAPTGVQVQFKGTQLAALAPGVGSGAAFDHAYATLNKAPVVGVLAPTLAYLSADSTDLDTGSFQYSDPFPGGWLSYADYGMYFHVTITAPGATGSVIVEPGLFSTVPVSSLTVLAPVVGPVTAPKIDGKDALVPQTTTASPVLTWGAPAVGTAGMFRVDIWQVTRFGTDTDAAMLTTFHGYTKATTFTIPPGVLTSGMYAFQISARSEPALDPSRPFSHTLPSGQAETLTAVMTVP